MKDSHFKVYCWTNSITKKSYVGYTGDGVQFRWSKHLLRARTGGQTYFDRALRKYDPTHWTCKVLFESLSETEAKKKEVHFISEFVTLAPHGYNSTQGGTGGNTWCGNNLETRKQKCSEIQTGVGNSNYSGITDEEILNTAFDFWIKNENWVLGEWKKLCKEKSIPQHIVKFRFAEYGGGSKGLKAALFIKVNAAGFNVKEIKYIRTQTHNQNTSKCLIGRIWVTNSVTGKSYLAEKQELLKENIVKGKHKKC